MARALMFALPLCGGLACLGADDALADPQGGAVVAGEAAIVQTAPGQVEIRQTTDKAIIDWKGFDIAQGEHTRFQQPGSGSITLNRVTGGGRSTIDGKLSANGHVWVINRNGVVFGPNAQVDVAGLVATTHDIRNDDFMAGRHVFEGAEDGDAMVENHGSITVKDAGLVGLVAPGVSNTGTITARMGEVTLASGRKFVVDFYGDQRINLAVDEPTKVRPKTAEGKPADALVSNAGAIFADGGRVRMTASAAKGIVDRVVNMSGIVRARTIERRGGDIILGGGDGAVEVSGTLDASADGKGGKGGSVVVTGGAVRLKSGSRIDVSGPGGGGSALIGGDFQGGAATAETLARYRITPSAKPVRTAETVVMEKGAVITADATSTDEAGNGGKVVLWSDGVTLFDGSLSARGGAAGGDGGLIETSSHGALHFDGRVDVAAPKGEAGNVLLDPTSITIATTGGTADGSLPTISGGTGAETVTLGALEAISSGTITLQASNDITVADLTLDGGDGVINLQSGVSLVLDSTVGGTVSFANTANSVVASGAGSVRIDSGYCAGSCSTSGSLSNIGIITTDSGSITLRGADGVTLAGALTTNGGAVDIDADADNKDVQAFSTDVAIATNGGALTIKAGGTGITLDGTVNLGSGTLTADTTKAGGVLTLGGAVTAGDLSYTENLALNDGSSVTLAAGSTLNLTGNVSLGAGGSVTLTADGFSATNAVTGNGATLTVKPATGSKDARLAGTAVGGEIDLTGFLTKLSTLGTFSYTNSTGSGAANITSALSLSPGLEVITKAAIDTGANALSVGAGKTIALESSGALTVGSTLTATGGLTLKGSAITATGGADSLSTTGAVKLEPATKGAAVSVFGTGATFDVSQTLLDAIGSSPSGVTIGRSDGTGTVTVGAGTVNTDTTLVAGGNVAITGALNASGHKLTLNTGGATTQTAAITATGLELKGTGSHTLTNVGNSVGTVAGDTGSVDLVNAGSLTVGTVTSTGLTGTGDITLYAAGASADLTVSSPIAVNSSTAKTLTLRADRDVIIDTTTVSATGSGAVSMVLNANRSDGGTGGIRVASSTLTSKGGDIGLVGGSSASGHVPGHGGLNFGRGILVTASTVDATNNGSGGDILMKGQAAAGSDYGLGIEIAASANVKTDGSGTITLDGIGGASAVNFSAGVSIYDNSSISTTQGAISLTGTNANTGANDFAIAFDADGATASRIHSTSGAITFTAADSGNAKIVARTTSGASKAYIGWDGATTTSGDITFTGNTIDLTPDGSSDAQMQVKSTGTVTFQSASAGTSVGVAGAAGGLQLSAATLAALQNGFSGIIIGRADGTAAVTLATYAFKDKVTARSLGAGGTVVVTGTVSTASGTGGGDITLTAASGVVVGAGAGVASADAVVFTADTVDIQGAVSGVTTLTIQPLNIATSVGIGGEAGTLNLTAAILDQLQNGFTLITIGRSDGTGLITVGTYAFKDPVVLQTPDSGGVITVTGALSTDAGNGGGDISLIAGSGVNLTTGSLDAGASALTVTADTMDIPAAFSVAGTGALTLQPLNAATTIGLAGGAGTFNLTAAELARLTGTFSGVTIGRSDGTGAITLGGALTLSDGLTLRNPGAGSGGIAIDGTLNIGAHDLTLNTTGSVTQSAAVTASGLALLGTGATHTLTNAANAFTTVAADTGTVTLANGQGFTIGTVGSTVGATTTGALTLTAGGTDSTLTVSQAVSVGGALSLSADRMALGAVIGAGANTATLAPVTAGRAVDLGSTTDVAASTLEISDAELDRITAGTLRVGSAAAGAMSITQAISPANTATMSLITGSTIAQGGAGSVTETNLRLTGGGAVSLATNDNSVDTVAISGTGSGTIAFRRDAGFVIGAVDGVNGVSATSAALVLTTTGTVTQTQAIAVSGLGLSGAGGSYTLTNAANAVATLAADTGSLSYRDVDGFVIGAVNPTGVTATGNVTLQAGGTVTQSAAITAAGLELLGSGVTYTLTNTANAVTTLAANTGVVSYTDADGFTVGTVNTVGLTTTGAATLIATATDSTLTVSQAVNTGGAVILSADRMALGAAIGAGVNAAALKPTTAGRAIDLGSATDVAVTTLELSTTELDRVTAGVLRIGDTGAGAITVSQALSPAHTTSLSLLSGSGLTQTAAITIANLKLGGSGTFDLGSLSNPVDVLAVSGSGGPTVSFRRDGAFSIGTVDGTNGASLSGGKLTLTSTGAVTQSQPIAASGLELKGTGGAFTLTDAANDVVTLAGNTGTVSYRDATAFAVGTVNTAGLTVASTDLSLTAGGAITQSAALSGVSRLSLTAGGAISLDVTGITNDVATLGAVTRGGAFGLSDSGGLTLDGAVDAHGSDVTIHTTGALTISANGTAAASGAGNVVLAAVGGEFTNSRGADAIFLGTGRWIVYGATRDGSTENGLAGTREYTRTFADNPPSSVTRTGNVFMYGNTPIITVTMNGTSRVYGDSNPSFTASYTGILTGDEGVTNHSGTPSFTTMADGGSSVGDYVVTPGLGGLVSPTGYAFQYVAGTVSITPAPLSVTADAVTKVYGDADPTLTLSATGLKLLDTAGSVLSGSVSRSAGENVGAYAITQGSLVSNGNYALSFTPGTLTIGKAALTVTATDLAKTYGDSDPTLVFTVSGLKFTDTAGSVLSGSVSRSAGENVGTYAITQGSLASSGNYSLGFTPGALTIGKATLTVTADAVSKTYGDADPTLGMAVSGLKFTDTASTALSGALARGAGEDAGTYAIFQGSLVSNGNYTLVFNGADMTIGKAALIIGVDNAMRTYGAANPDFSLTARGLKGADSLAALGITAETDGLRTSDVGSYAIRPVVGTLRNYDVVTAPGTLTIAKAPLLVTVADGQRDQGVANPSFTPSFEGFVLGQGASALSGALGFDTPAGTASAAGSYQVIPFGLSSPNYEIVFRPGTLTVRPPSTTIPPTGTAPGATNTVAAITQAVNTVNAVNAVATTTAVTTAVTAPVASPGVTPVGTTPAGMLTSLETGRSPSNGANPPPVVATNPAAVNQAISAGTAVQLSVGGQSVTYSPGALSAYAAGQSLNQPSPALLVSPNVVAAAARLAGAIASGGVGQAVSAMSSLSIAERKAALKNIPVGQLVSGLLTSDDPTARAVGEILQSAVDGGTGGYASVKAAVEAGEVAHDDALTYLAMFQYVQRETKTESWAGALDELRTNPDSVEVFAPQTGRDSSIVTLAAPRRADSGRQVIEGVIADSGSIREARVNGRWVFVDDQGNFSTDIALVAGENQVTLTVTDENGKVSERVITVNADEATPAAAAVPKVGRKIALMIAADDYQNAGIPPLNTPQADAAAVADALNERLGYETRVLRNPTKADIVNAMRELGREVAENDQVLVYYAGHGYEMAETGTGYWLPTDAAPDNPSNWISNNDVGRFLNRMPAKQIMVVSDSCYSGAFTREQKVTPGGPPPDPAALLERRAVMAMSSGGDEPVADGETHSPFANALLNRVNAMPRDSGGYELFSDVRDDVIQEVPQTPQYGVIKAAGYDDGGDYVVGVKNGITDGGAVVN